MDRFDKELREQLAGDPLVRNGFDEQLRRRIEERIREKQRASRRFSAIATFAGAGALLLAAVWVGIWRLTANPQPLAERTLSTPAAQVEERIMFQPKIGMRNEEAKIRSALLVGIRADEPDPAGPGVLSSYRSLLVAPENGVLQVAAEGSGILMPYGREFWKIRSIRDPHGGLRLVAAPAVSEARLFATISEEWGEAGADGEQGAGLAAAAGKVYEQVLFAGNRYVSVRQERFGAEGETAPREFLWVKHVEQLTAKAVTKAAGAETGAETDAGKGRGSVSRADGETEPHVALSEVLPADTPGAGIEQWAIVREPGRWAIRYPEERSDEGGPGAWRAYPATLPSSVVSHDRLDLSWEEIARLDPLAKDVFTSPAQDVLALVRDDGIRVLPYRLPDAASRSVFVPMDDHETIVMVQWALDRYVDEWKRQAAVWLAPVAASSP